ncbi:hypothetical protein COO60DRAFT_1489815 [Scenedesmus sp. NREL 46B-D3]|nr:hypothetical protein COO60DRAFT_1489815 [Scenedesmus sp. NREL 46B-D3]
MLGFHFCAGVLGFSSLEVGAVRVVVTTQAIFWTSKADTAHQYVAVDHNVRSGCVTLWQLRPHPVRHSRVCKRCTCSIATHIFGLLLLACCSCTVTQSAQPVLL